MSIPKFTTFILVKKLSVSCWACSLRSHCQTLKNNMTNTEYRIRWPIAKDWSLGNDNMSVQMVHCYRHYFIVQTPKSFKKLAMTNVMSQSSTKKMGFAVIHEIERVKTSILIESLGSPDLPNLNPELTLTGTLNLTRTLTLTKVVRCHAWIA